MNTISPCMDCTDRVFGCWTTCDRYSDWRAQKDQRRQKIEEARKSEHLINNFKAEQIRKTRRKK